MKLLCVPCGALEANCYLVSDGQSAACAVVDPGGEAARLEEICREHGLQPQVILLTHGHVDHMAGAAELKAATGAPVLIHDGDRDFVEHPHPYFAQMVGGAPAVQVDGELTDGQKLLVGELTLEVLHTPGHSPGSVCLLVEEALLTGDTLFAGSVGRTDLPGGSTATLEASLRRLLDTCQPETMVYPGHGPASTIEEEAETNPWLQ